MQAVLKQEFVSVEDYLAEELSSEVRHEYVGGVLYAMAGASKEHNTVAGNAFAAIRSHLRKRKCQVFIGDLKVRLQVAGDDIFYYPDVIVSCDRRDTERYYLRFPKIIVEVLSESTERTDRREKFLSYTRIDSLEEYVLVAQDRREVTVFRRNNGWKPEVFRAPDQILRLRSIKFEVPLRVIYEGVKTRVPSR